MTQARRNKTEQQTQAMKKVRYTNRHDYRKTPSRGYKTECVNQIRKTVITLLKLQLVQRKQSGKEEEGEQEEEK